MEHVYEGRWIVLGNTQPDDGEYFIQGVLHKVLIVGYDDPFFLPAGLGDQRVAGGFGEQFDIELFGSQKTREFDADVFVKQKSMAGC